MIVLTDYFVNFGTSKNREDTWTPTPTQLGYTENPISSGFHVESPVHVFLPSVLKILLRNDGWRALFKWTQSMSAPLNTRLCHTAKSPHRSTVFELTNGYVESSLQVYTSRESTNDTYKYHLYHLLAGFIYGDLGFRLPAYEQTLTSTRLPSVQNTS